MQEKKTNLLGVLQILRDYSDEEHILSQKEIAAHLLEEYGLTIDRRTVYKDIRMLMDFGFDISTYAENESGYYLRNREFTQREVYLLCNAISSSNYISAEEGRNLISKLIDSQSIYRKEFFRERVLIENNKEESFSDFFDNAEKINNAIAAEHAITFDYLHYNREKQLIKLREDGENVSPYRLIKVKDVTYLICRKAGEYRLSHYRLDRISNVSLSENTAFVPKDPSMDTDAYVRANIFMEEQMEMRVVRLICNYSILDDVLDLFGKDIEIREYNKDYFFTTVSVSKQAIMYIALQYVDAMEIVEPKEMREEMKKYLFKGNMKYI